jgi:hypothetical protein
MDKSFNLNSKIKVKLKEEGFKILESDWGMYLPWAQMPNFRTQVDEKGYYEIQAWQFIQLFGEFTNLGDVPYETIILINETDLT